MPATVFISYSHQDARWKDRLVEQLGPIEQEDLLQVWHDGLIRPGTDWLPEIEAAMAEARVAVLLVTASFLKSEFIRKREFAELLRRRQADGLWVIPVFVRPCNWQVSPLGSIQGRPAGGKALSRLSRAIADEELARIAAEILDLVRGKAAPEEAAMRRPEAGPVTFASLHQLPSPPGDFTGRVRELEALRRLAAAAGDAVILGVFGMGGVGKTALALKFAEDMARHYPDGQIYLDLQGMTMPLQGITMPLSVPQARVQVVRSFLPEARMREKDAESAAAYQSVLHGKRALIFLDNAADPQQVEPLRPPRGCALIVTSRHHFVLPGMATANLDELPPEEARALLLRISPRIGAIAEELARLCGGLPLALRLAASTLALRHDLSPGAYVRRLAQGVVRLGEVDAALAASCSWLAKDLRRLWSLLAVFPATFDAVAATAVWELEEIAGDSALGQLMTSSLIDWEEAVARYRLHDLARLYADRQLADEEKAAARRRHATHFLAVLDRADALCRLWGEQVLRGLGLLEAEWTNIEAGQAWARAHPEATAGAATLLEAYSNAGAYCLVLRLSPSERLLWHEPALAAARSRLDRTAEARHLGRVAIARADLGQRRQAIELHEQCLKIARETGDLDIEGDSLTNLGVTYAALGENRRAIEFYERRLAMATEASDRRGEGDAVNYLGLAYAALGEDRHAIELYERRLAIAGEIGDHRDRSVTLNNIGLAYAALGETGRAIELYERSLALAREIGDRRGEAGALKNMGLVYAALGAYGRAIELYEQHLAVAREYSDRFAEGSSLGNLGLAYTEMGETGRARECFEEQLAIARKTEDRWSEGRASWNLGLVFEKQGDLVRAMNLMQVMVELERDAGLADAEQDAAQVEEIRARVLAEGSPPPGP
jgi:tetratricopeptide (TPR) repeat protein